MAGLLISIQVYQNITCRQVKLLLWLNNNQKNPPHTCDCESKLDYTEVLFILLPDRPF